jgi:hypothetical protein
VASDPRLSNIPAELKDRPQWVIWQLAQRDGKATKLPYNPKTGELADSTKASTWGTIQEALIGTEKYSADGIGFVFSEGDPYTGIDLDSCRDPDTGEVEPWAQEIIDRFESYTEITPSGRGFHVIIEGTLPPGARRKPKIECYDRARYFTVTGNVLNGSCAIAERQAELEAFHKDVFRSQETTTLNHSRAPVEPLDMDDGELVELARSADDGGKFSTLWAGDWAGAGYPSQSEADQALCNKLAFWTGRDRERMSRLFRQSGLYRKKWDRADYSGKTLDHAIELCKEVYKPPRPKSESGNGECPSIQWSEEYSAAPSNRTAEPLVTASHPEKQCPEIVTGAEFPFHVMSGFAGDFARIYSEYMEPPAQFFYMAALTCLGNILSGQVTLESEIAPQPRINLLILGESADDRKSTVLEKTVGFFRSYSFEKILNVCHGVGSAEGLQAKLSDLEGAGARRLILIYDEFKSFVGKCKIESSVLLPCVTTLFESNHYESRTKHSKVELEDVHLSILAASTVDTFNNIWTSQFTDIGFNNRLFLVTGRGERRFSIPRKIPRDALDALKSRLALILSSVREVGEFEVTDEAFQFFDTWYRQLENSIHTKRLDTYALRFMPLLAINDLKDVVDLGTVQKAVALCDWQLRIRKLHDPIDCDSAMARMEEKMRRALRTSGNMKDWELKRATHAGRDGLWIYDRAKLNLLKAREITFDRTTKEYGWIGE